MSASARPLPRLLLVLAAAAAACRAHQVCNGKTIRNIVMDHCDEFRGKRSAQEADYASMIEPSHARKRQIMSIREIIVSSRVPMYDIPYPPVPSSARHAANAPVVPPTVSDATRTSRGFESLTQESGSDLGFEMNYDEVLELFTEMYGRMPRSPSVDELKIAAFECCKNIEVCKTRKVMPCPREFL